MFASKPLNLIFDHRHFQVSMDVFIADVPRRLDNASHHLVLERLDDFDVGLLGAAPELDAISPYWL